MFQSPATDLKTTPTAMRVAVLVSGMPRGFMRHLWKFLNDLPENFDIYLSFPFSADDDKYMNVSLDIPALLSSKRVKLITFGKDAPDIPPYLTQRERNTVLQWHRLHDLFLLIPKIYDRIVRCRPDVHFSCSPAEFTRAIQTAEPDQIYIPCGYDLFDSSVLPTSEQKKCLNDQVAFGHYEPMRHYCTFAKALRLEQPIISEHQLFTYIPKVERIPIQYKLILSDCFSFAICGDSGAGKTHISNILSKILPFDKSLVFETDRYHKWERGSSNYLTYTHLNPEANDIHRFSEEAYKLTLGEEIFTVDYDHSTGKFTAPEEVKSNNYLIFCGLHTLYTEKIQKLYDLKLYIDTEPSLKRFWKLQRDTVERGATAEKVLAAMETRKEDYIKYIEPQREAADIIVYYYPKTPENFSDIAMDILCSPTIGSGIFPRIGSLATKISHAVERITYSFDTVIPRTKLFEALEGGIIYNKEDLNEGLDGILQAVVLAAIWKPNM